ncbi:Uncharacterised protein [marine metagenome]
MSLRWDLLRLALTIFSDCGTFFFTVQLEVYSNSSARTVPRFDTSVIDI